MKRYFYTLTITLIGAMAHGQNNSFEAFAGAGAPSCCRQECGDAANLFNQGRIKYWSASHGSPQLNKIGCDAPQNDVFAGNYCAFMVWSTPHKEGIFRSQSIKKDESFNFSIMAKGTTNGATLVVKFANGLTNEDPPQTQPTIPTPASEQLILSIQLTTTWTEFRVDEFIADADYSQLWVYPVGNDILVDEVSINKSCCEPYKVWQDIINPPSTYVNNYIKAGENVDAGQPFGKVIITPNAQPVIFQAGQTIELLPGFETQPGADFTAVIKPCSETPLQISVAQNENPIGEGGPVDEYCFRQYLATACYGSGEYNYLWLDNMESPNLGERFTKVFQTANDMNITVRAIDAVTADTAFKTILVPGQPFIGNFSGFIPNIITPNGDGLNDVWKVIDSSRLGSDSFGYNAYRYELDIFDRWGSLEFNNDGLNKSKGFSFDEIFWDEDYCEELPSGTYFGVLELENCSQTDIFEFTISLLCESSEPFLLDNNPESSNSDILIFPNPTSSKLNIRVDPSAEYEISLYDQTGNAINHQHSKNIEIISVDLSSEARGTYILQLKKGRVVKSTKLIILK